MSQLSKYGSTWPNKWLSIDVQLGASCACEETNFKVLSAPHGETEAENIYHCPQMSAKAVDSLYTRICLRTSNLLDSYYQK